MKAQWNVGQISDDSIRFDISANGVLFNKSGQPSFEVPANSANHMFGLASFWMMGLDGSKVYGSMTKSNTDYELWPGPIDTVTGLPTDPQGWNYVWSISKEEIDFHRLHFKDNDYVPNENLMNWPSKHSQSNVNPILAPFIDWNQDGKYNPLDGDYPSVPGKFNLYFIANDAAGEHSVSGTQKLGIELQGLIYTMSESWLDKTVFARLFVINHSNRDYSPFYFGTFTKMELGNNSDNYCGSDINRRMIYGYNGDDFDEGHFGSYLPQAAMIYLNQNMQSSIAFNENDSVRKLPVNVNEFKNVMEGRWRTGNDMTIGENGKNGSTKSNYIYFGKSDPNHPNIDWEDAGSNDGPGMRQMMSVSKVESLKARGYMEVEMAFTAVNGAENKRASIETRTDEILENFGKLSSTYEQLPSSVNIYPNPIHAGDWLNIGLKQSINSIQIFDTKGILIEEHENFTNNSENFKFRCSEFLISGIYYLKITTRSEIYNKTLIILAP